MTQTSSRVNTKAEAPTAPGYPLIGSMLTLQSDPLALLQHTAELGDVARFRAMGLVAYVLSEPDAIRHVLVDNQRNYTIGVNSRLMMKHWLGEGLFVSDGELWLTQRRLMQPLFHRNSLTSFAATMTKRATVVGSRWQSQIGQTIDVGHEMMRLTLEIASQTLVNIDLSRDAATFSHAVTEMVEFYGYWIRSMVLALVPHKLMRWHPRFKRALATLDILVHRIIAERRRLASTELDHPDLLSMLLAARDEETGEGMSDQQLRDEIMTLLFAGHETTASALTWTWYLLSQHPTVQARLHDELDSVLAGRPPMLDDLSSLVYTRMVIQEAMRLYPPVWSTFRKALGPDVIGGYSIQVADRIAVSPYIVHRNPRLWPNPEQFDPDRFEAGWETKLPKFAYLPFGGGPRQCIGSHFAMMEMPLVLATLAQRYQLALRPGNLVKPEALLTLRPQKQLLMTLMAR